MPGNTRREKGKEVRERRQLVNGMLSVQLPLWTTGALFHQWPLGGQQSTHSSGSPHLSGEGAGVFIHQFSSVAG